MSYLDKVFTQLKEHEGLVLKPYKCTANKLTIGYGHNLEDNGLTKTACEFILFEDIKEAKRNLYAVFTKDFFDDLCDKRKIALIDMMFNLGLSKFLTFKRFIQAVKTENWNRASVEMIHSKAYTQAKRRYQLLAEEILG